MFIPDLFREFDSINQCRRVDKKKDKIQSSLPENMNISPCMASSSSPIKTDWLKQLACGTNEHIFY